MWWSAAVVTVVALTSHLTRVVSAVPSVQPVHTGLTYGDVLLTAGTWSTSIGNLNPNYLTNEMKMKGIKHFVEYLSLLEELVTFGNASVAEWAMEKVEEAVQVGRCSCAVVPCVCVCVLYVPLFICLVDARSACLLATNHNIYEPTPTGALISCRSRASRSTMTK